jgi:hypothetical protein
MDAMIDLITLDVDDIAPDVPLHRADVQTLAQMAIVNDQITAYDVAEFANPNDQDVDWMEGLAVELNMRAGNF